MRCPFPGMDPYLETPDLWPDVHDSLIAAIRDELSPILAPRYVARLNRRTYLLHQDDLDLVGVPDVAILSRTRMEPRRTPDFAPVPAGVGLVEVEVPLLDEVSESYLEIRTGRGALITTIEILSPVNKVNARGRREYESKRNEIFSSMTNLVEIDLLRQGKPLPVIGPDVGGEYRVLVSRGLGRPSAHLYFFGLRDAIPAIPIPLRPEDAELAIDLNTLLHALYDRARYDLEIDYAGSIAPPLSDADASWARDLVA